MLQSCSRCSAPAAVVMSYNYAQSAVWLDDLSDPVEPGAGYALCPSHAERLSPPRGWTLKDRRSVPRLFVPLEVA